MEDRKKANATNDNISLKAGALTDLPVTDKQADETKGGTIGVSPTSLSFSSTAGGGDNDGFDDIIVGAGVGAVGGHVK